MNEGTLSARLEPSVYQEDRPMVNETVRQENKIRQINIEEVNRGYIVRVGCHTFAISTKEEMIGKLVEYINEPSKTEEKWFKQELF